MKILGCNLCLDLVSHEFCEANDVIGIKRDEPVYAVQPAYATFRCNRCHIVRRVTERAIINGAACSRCAS